VTPSARLRRIAHRAGGNIHLGARCGGCRRRCCGLALCRRHRALGARLADAITFQGSVTDSDGIDHFRIVTATA